MHVLSEMIRHVVVLILLTTFLDLLLPSSSMQRYIKVVMGLFIIITLINPVFEVLFKNSTPEIMAWQQESSLRQTQGLGHQGQRLQQVNQELLTLGYRQKLEAQMMALIKLVQEAPNVEIEVECGEATQDHQAEIKGVTVRIHREPQVVVEPIRIKNSEVTPSTPETREEKMVAEKISALLCQYFGLQKSIVKIIFC